MSVMTLQSLPSGISVTQAKKDAKKLSKKLGIPLSEAQNKIAFKHSRSVWAKAISQSKLDHHFQLSFQSGCLSKSRVIENIEVQESISVILGMPGAGKTVLLLEIASQCLKQGLPVTLLSTNSFDDLAVIPELSIDEEYTHQLKNEYGDRFTIINPFDSKGNLAIDQLSLNGDVLLIDDCDYIFINGIETSEKKDLDLQSFRSLIKASRFTFIALQTIHSDFDFFSPKELNFFFLAIERSLQFLNETSGKLITSELGEKVFTLDCVATHRDFYFVGSNKTQKMRLCKPKFS